MQVIRSPEFLLSVVGLNDILGVTISLSRLLQTPILYLKKATDAIEDTTNVLEEKRAKAESIFSGLYYDVLEIAENHQNHPAESCEEYLRRAVYIPLLDNVITDLKDRLSTEDLIGQSATFITLKQKLLWVPKWKRVVKNKEELPDSVLGALENFDIDMYPTIHKLLRILATFPVSVTTAERSFSTLHRLKTWLQANISEERLIGLVLMSVHREIPLDPEAIIFRFAKTKRCQEFVF
ncbi:hypothetical protein PR048_003106 [Dryococelus australis]|uniref:HAT C-terminal dimerisation domain-containing protein n=1 Tax=Dryococelus australis TaxID=614101 RepID=A0ABQ9IN42_9NEOP|nr:hypothetical protein PR048_003106 [Dryococelus australis]